MPSSVNGVSQTSHLKGQESWSDIGKMFKDALNSLVNRVCVAAKLTPPQRPVIHTSPAANTTATADANAEAANNAPACTANQFDSMAWMANQCKILETAMTNPNGGSKVSLENLYKVAKEFKQQINNNLNNLQENWPQELQADFQANLELIQTHFNGADSTQIPLEELKFLQGYLGFMQSCLGNSNQDLDSKLGAVKSLLDDAIKQVRSDIQVEKTKLETATSNITKLEPDEATRNERITELEAQENLTTDQHSELNTCKSKRDSLIKAREEVNTGKKAINKLQNNFSLIELPPLTRATENAQVAMDAAVANLEAARRQNPAATTEQLNELNGIALQAIDHLEVEKAKLDAADVINLESNGRFEELHNSTLTLHSRGQELRAARCGLGEAETLREPSAIFNASVKQLEQQFHEVSIAAIHCKKPEKSWMKATVELRNELAKLNANPETHEISLSDVTRTAIRNFMPGNQKASGYSIAHANVDIPLYQHACNMVDEKEHQPQNSHYRPKTEEKKLALLLLGAWCAQQTTTRSHHAEDSHFKTSKVIDSAADMLVGKMLDNKLTAGNVSEIRNTKTAIDMTVKKVGMSEVAKELGALPEGTSNDHYKRAFLNAVALSSAESFASDRRSASDLIGMAKTDRTFTKDRTTSNWNLTQGRSRQSVFRENMIRAMALMKNEPELGKEGPPKDIPISIGTGFKSADVDVIKARLGLGNQADHPEATHNELLDHLVLSAIVQNDLSLNDDHTHRGSMIHKINKYDKHSVRETMKNHDLSGYAGLGEALTDTAIGIRGDVKTAIAQTKTALNGNQPINNQALNRLVKQIIITTDSRSALNENFSLRTLTETSENLIKSNTPENRAAMVKALASTERAWASSLTDNQPTPVKEHWNTEDGRSKVSSILTYNPVRTLPFVNRVPLLSQISHASFALAKTTVFGAVGAALGTAAGAAVLAACPVALAVIGAYKLQKGTSR